MIPEIGFFSLILALMLALAQSTLPLIGAQRKNRILMSAGGDLAAGQLVLIGLAFACLCYGFVTSDFTVKTIAENSHTAKPLLYRFSATWGNHEGSMLLWVLILAFFGWTVARFGQDLPPTLAARVLSVQGMIGAAFLAFIVFTSNPFERLGEAPLDGAGLNPLLQDPGLAFHPPFLYLGYVGFSMAFSFSVAALIEGRVDSAWERWVRPWTLAAWCFLTIGIAMGSLWAYYELGWGGWWFWDPVENASLMPWLAGTALLHSALVVERRQTMVNWTILLGIVTFSLSLIGTFLVRSGVLTSVHAFALDPARGVFILAILFAASGGALSLYAWRAPSLSTGPTFAPVSREGSLVLNNIFLISGAATVFLGTFYPLLIDAMSNDKISVGPPYYNMTFAPIMTPMLVAMSIGPLMKWRKDTLTGLGGVLRWPVAAFVATFAGIAVFTGAFLSGVGMALAVWLIAGPLALLARRMRLGSAPFADSIRLGLAQPRAAYGMLIAHAAMGVTTAGIVAMNSWSVEDIRIVSPGDSFTLAGYDITMSDIRTAQGPNYQAERAVFNIARHGAQAASISSEQRFYPVRRQQTTEAGIRTILFSNIYIALGESRPGGWVVRSYFHPLATLIWLGALGMALGGFVSLSDRRFRLGARLGAGVRQAELAPAPAE